MRGHGETSAPDELDLSAATLTADALAAIAHLQGVLHPAPAAPQPLFLVGHSMGGAVAARAACGSPTPVHLRGLVVVDVVEARSSRRQESRRPSPPFSLLSLRPRHCCVTYVVQRTAPPPLPPPLPSAAANIAPCTASTVTLSHFHI